MTFVEAAVERTTAATDLVLAAVALVCLVRVWRARAGDGLGRSLWTGVFALVAFSAVLGAAVHGLVMRPRANFWFWQFLNLALGLAVAFFAGAAAGDISGKRFALRILPLAFAACGVSLFFSCLYPSSFLSFIVYEGAVTFFVLWLYLRATMRGDGPGARLGACGAALLILASAVQTVEPLRFTLVFPFDNNGAFHLIEVPALFLLAAAAARPPSATED